MTSCKPLKIPMAAGSHIPAHSQDERDPRYRHLVGKLFWLLITRPDIAYAVKELGRHGERNGPEHMRRALDVVRYLSATQHYKLHLHGCDDPVDLVLRCYVDSSYANCTDTRRSSTGIVMTLGTSAIRTKSVTQKNVAISACEAELNGLFECCLEVVHIRRGLQDLGIAQPRPTPVYMDSQSAMKLLQGLRPTGRSKHIDVRFFKIKELIDDGTISLHYEPTETLVADALTKPLAHHKLRELSSRILEGQVRPSNFAEACQEVHHQQRVTNGHGPSALTLQSRRAHHCFHTNNAPSAPRTRVHFSSSVSVKHG
jgi:hypothetical protein